jgi:hypothetical protein
MEYMTPELRELGSFAELTLGTGGSCLDGAARNNNQLGGGDIGGEGDVECGPGTGGNE